MTSTSEDAPDAETAPAKVNLYLHVVGRRHDGYHLLDSLVVFAAVADRISVRPADTLSVEVTGPFAPALVNEADNLVLRAARLLASTGGRAGSGPGAALTLEKNLPVASGIGGGSADAAATLRLLRRFWRAEMSDAALQSLGARLGADVPACLAMRPLRMGGIGEVLDTAPQLPEQVGLILVNPGVALSTPDVFRRRQGGFTASRSLPPGWRNAEAMADDLASFGNDLEPPARGLCSGIDTALALLRSHPDCLLARMSGAGATCFGLWPSPLAARRAVQDVDWPAGWWVWAGGLRATVDAALAHAY